MRYVKARLEQEQREMAYRLYVTDSLQNIPQQKFMTKRFADVIINKPEDTRTGDEIAAEVIAKAGLTLGIEL